jgi:hypothetical protein
MTSSLAARPAVRVWSMVSPTMVTALVLLSYLAIVLIQAGGDPLAFARIGDGFSGGQPIGREGYDGQFAYWIALNPRPEVAGPYLDVPAYRYQRILLPILARVLALGQPGLIAWALVAVNVAGHLAGTRLFELWLEGQGASRWFALAYGLWAGLLLAVRLDLAEPLSYGLVVAALLAAARERLEWSTVALSAALLAKETALVFAVALLAWALLAGRWRAFALFTAGLAPFALLQLLLWRWFGSPGLASGGYMATGFEAIPYLGFWRITGISLPAFALLAAIFGPLVIAPSMWGAVAVLKRLWRRDYALPVLALGAHAAAIAFTPLSTFREPLGLLRLATGLVLATVMFGAHVRSRRVLVYSQFWLCALVFLVKE